jgi:hypothetical protein
MIPTRSLLALGAVLVLPGCAGSGPPLPETFVVRGRVIHKGGWLLEGGQITFRSVADPTLLASSVIAADGTFSLETFRENRKVAGAAAGEYWVTVIPPMGEDRTVTAVQLAETYRVKPAGNDFTIEIKPEDPG